MTHYYSAKELDMGIELMYYCLKLNFTYILRTTKGNIKSQNIK
jgi:hypothetical protein